MNKRELILFLAILLLIQSITAVEINLKKSSYQPQETLQAEITGNFISLKSDNILIYKEGIPRPNPVISGLTNQNNKYYFYAVLPNSEGNFSLKIENSEYTEAGVTKTDTIIKTFTIIRENKTSLSINPGFIIVLDKDFSIKIKSLNGNSNVKANFELTGETKNLSIIEDDEKTISFSIINTSLKETNLKINNYNIPVFILSNLNMPPYIPPIFGYGDITFIPNKLNGKLLADKNYFYKIILQNTGNNNLTNIKLSSDLQATINPSFISSLFTGRRIGINITITIPSDAKSNISENIIAEYENKTSYFPVFFEITKNESNIVISEPGPTIPETCSDIGSICNFDEDCNGNMTGSLEGPCCIGTCVKKKKSSNSGTLWGIILLVVVLAVIGFILWKAKKKQVPKSTEEILKDKTEKFEKRMKEIGPSKEIKGGLSKI